MSTLGRHWKGLLAGAVVLVVVLAVGVPWVYIHLVEGSAPAPLGLSSVPASATAAAATATATSTTGTVTGSRTAGTWTVSSGSQAGYRVHEVLAGQSTTAVGRTSSVTGSVTLRGDTVTAADVTVQMADVTSDRSQRDQQFAGRIMDTAEYPTGTFTLTAPVHLAALPAVGATVTATATGDLTLHGTTRPVTLPVSIERTASGYALAGDLTVAYADYGIDNPSFGGFVTVGDGGTIEFLLLLTPA